MSLLVIALFAACLLMTAYLVYGRILTRLFNLQDSTPTPAVEMRDDVDYVPIEPKFLIGQHFSAIAAAGPIVGPILAGLMFGWLPALVWILVGSILIGGVHDFASLVASIRHKASSIAEIVRDHMTRRSYLLFLTFIWITLVYIIVAFTDITASAFVGSQTLETGEVVSGGGIATSSLLYIMLPMIMGLLLRFTRMSLALATIVFVPMIVGVIWLGQKIPLDLAVLLNLSPANAQKVWDVIILGYCLIAAMLPMWLLLQPRGHLGGFFLLGYLAAGILGLLFGGKVVEYPAFKGWSTLTGENLAPILFITIACGACSGFHSLISSGTTSKQLRRESDARVIGYGTMLLEAMVAVISLSCVMMLAANAPLLQDPKPQLIFAQGIGGFLEMAGIPSVFAISFMLMAFTTFVYDTLDICTRLGKYIVQELTGLKSRAGGWLGTSLTAGVPLLFVFLAPSDGQPAWRTFWSLFGASNQLLAALALLGVTVWLWRSTGKLWPLFVTGLPCIFMYTMSVWALVNMTMKSFAGGLYYHPVTWVGVVLIVLAGLMMLEALFAFWRPRPKSGPKEALAATG